MLSTDYQTETEITLFDAGTAKRLAQRQANRAIKPETREEIAKRLFVEALVMVARQRQLVSRLGSKGYATDEANRLLDRFETAFNDFRRTLALLDFPQA